MWRVDPAYQYQPGNPLIKFIKLLVLHRAYGSVRVIVESIHGDVAPRYEACLHKAPDDDSKASI